MFNRFAKHMVKEQDKKALDLSLLSAGQTKRLNELYSEYSMLYTEYIDEIANENKDSIFWSATPLGSRDCFLSNTLRNICLLRMCIDEVNDNEIGVVFVNDTALKTAITSNVGHTINVIVRHKKISFRKIVRRILNFQLFCIIRLCFRYIRKINMTRKLSAEPEICDEETVVFCSYRELSEFSDKHFSDRYFTGLSNLTSQSIIFLDSPYYSSWTEGEELIKRITHLKNHVLVGQMIKYTDIAEIMRYWLYCNTLKLGTRRFDGMIVNSLLEDDIKRGAVCDNACYGILRGKAIGRLIDRYDHRIKAVVEWYEGQPSSNAMFTILRKNHPDVLTVAYTYGPIGETDLQTPPSNGQLDNKTTAEVFAVHGREWEAEITRFTDKACVVAAPSFRFASLYGKMLNQDEDVEPNSLLAVLPMDRSVMNEFIEVLTEALSVVDGKKLYIKEHPSYDGDSKDTGLYMKAKATYLHGSLNEAIRNKETVVACETTSFSNIVLNGIRCICYVPRGHLISTYTPKRLRKSLKMVFSAEEMVDALRKITKDHLSDAELNNIRYNSFSITDRDSVDNFLDKIDEFIIDKRKGVTV